MSPEEFTKHWLESSTLDEAVRKIGSKKQTVKERARFMRAKGVKLPKLEGEDKNIPNRLSVLSLNEQIRKHLESLDKLSKSGIPDNPNKS